MKKFKLIVSGWIEIDQTVVVDAEDSEKAADKALKVAGKLDKAPEMDKLVAKVAKNPKLMAQLEKAVKAAGVNVELAEDESGLDMGDLKTMALNLAKKGFVDEL